MRTLVVNYPPPRAKGTPVFPVLARPLHLRLANSKVYPQSGILALVHTSAH